MEFELVTIAEFARRHNLARQTIKGKIDRGIISSEAVVKLEGKKYPLLDFELATKSMERNSNATFIAAGKITQQKLSKKKPTEQNNHSKTEKQIEGSGLGVENNNVQGTETNQKPEDEAQKSSNHSRKLKIAPPENATFDEESGLYIHEDVYIRQLSEEVKVAYAVDVYMRDSERLNRARANNEEMKSKEAELKLAEREGRLLDKEKVRQKIIQHVTSTREAVLAVPDQLGPELLACRDLAELQTTLSKGLNKALENLGVLIKERKK